MSVAITVVGAGVAGLCCATELVSRGATVRLVDRHGGPGTHHCSWWAGGMLAPICESETAEPLVARLGSEAAGWWQAQGVDVVRRGTLVVALGRDRSELDRFARRVAHAGGTEMLDGAALCATEPQLAGRFDRALLVGGEAHLDPRAALLHLAARLAEGGTPIETGQAIPEGATLDCRGLSARDALQDLRGVKGEMCVLHAPEVSLTRPVRLLHPRYPLYVVPRGDGVFMLGATQIESGERGRATVRSVLELLSAAYALHPAFGEAELVEIGTDARPAFPDNLPRLRRAGQVVHVNGLFRHGYLLAPAMARMAADLMLEGRRPEVMDDDDLG